MQGLGKAVTTGFAFMVAVIVMLSGGFLGCGGGADVSGNLPPGEEFEGFVPDEGTIDGQTKTVDVTLDSGSRAEMSIEVVSLRDAQTRVADQIASWRDELTGGRVAITFFKLDQPASNPFTRSKNDLSPDNARWSVQLPFGLYAVRALGYPAGQSSWTLFGGESVWLKPDSEPQPVSLRMIKRENLQADVEAIAGYADEAVLVHSQGSAENELRLYDLSDLDRASFGTVVACGTGLLWKYGTEVGDFNLDQTLPGTFPRVWQFEEMFGELFAYGDDRNLYHSLSSTPGNWSPVQMPHSTVSAIASERHP